MLVHLFNESLLYNRRVAGRLKFIQSLVKGSREVSRRPMLYTSIVGR